MPPPLPTGLAGLDDGFGGRIPAGACAASLGDDPYGDWVKIRTATPMVRLHSRDVARRLAARHLHEPDSAPAAADRARHRLLPGVW
jgi:hypothetical protein